MGVTGLWRLIEPAGKPVPVETLENKILAVDISIWLHQMVKGYQDAKGAPLPNAHLMGLFQRICKLLYFRIKPVFVFDGSFPDLKKETIARRQDHKSKYNSQSEKLRREIALLLGKKTAISTLLGKQISPKKNKQLEEKDDLFKLPALPQQPEASESESEDEQDSSASTVDLHTVDLESDKFQSMPIKEKYDLLIELKETRKMNSWGKINSLPKKSDNFSDFQMQRLLKRRKLQECLEETEKEMGDSGMSLNELESLLNEEGIDTKIESLANHRIASNNTTRYLLISNVKQAIEDAKKKDMEAQTKICPGKSTDSSVSIDTNVVSSPHKDELEDDLEKAIKMSLECVNDAETSACASKTDDSWTSFLTDSDYSDHEDDDGYEPPAMTSAKAYIMQYSDFTSKAIDNIVAPTLKDKNKSTQPQVSKIIEDLNKEKSIIEDNIELSSSDDNGVQDDGDNIKVLRTSEDRHDVIKNNETNMNMNDTQASIICVENCMDDIISLDSSTENINDHNFNPVSNQNIKNIPDSSLQSDSSDSEFEEVSDSESKSRNTVVQLTLDMGKEVDDDIFADIFEDQRAEIQNLATCSDNNKKKVLENPIMPNVIGDQKNKNMSEKLDDCKESNKNVKAANVTVKKETPRTLIECDEKSKNAELSVEEPLHKIDSNEGSTTIIEVKEKDVPTTEELNSMMTEIETENEELLQEKGRLDRIGRNITEQMTKEAQELLRVFGIPYIVAPMEAEAQCAFLENAKLTDGTITDDSDIWLFGGRTVYKNFFNQKKHVLQFLSERIETSFKLTREQLVLLALLVGSDYTTGVSGIGPVTALEILASFPFSKKKLLNETSKQAQYQELITGLQEFKKWVKAGKRTDNISLKKKLKNVVLSDEFPSVRVVQAYMEPNVEKNEEKFTWGELDTTILRDYAKTKFGWSQHKLDEIIKPVLKRLLDRKNQKTVHDYFKRKIDFQSLEDQMSKRVKEAVQKIGSKEGSVRESNEETAAKTTGRKKRKASDSNKSAPRKAKQTKKPNETENIEQIVKTSIVSEEKMQIDINVPKTGRYQEIIPQRETDKKNLLESKLKAIEIFRKTKIDRKRKNTKRKLPTPKEQAELSESDSA